MQPKQKYPTVTPPATQNMTTLAQQGDRRGFTHAPAIELSELHAPDLDSTTCFHASSLNSSAPQFFTTKSTENY